MILEFQDPEFLWLLLTIPLIAILRGRSGQGAAILFSSTAIAKKVASKKRSKAGGLLVALRLFALTFLIIALARPQLGKDESFTKASGIDIVLTVDLSSSMLALDFANKNNLVTRLDVAKTVIEDFIKERPHDRIGLIAFGGNPYLVSPQTLNHNWLNTNLERLEVGLVEDGTAIGDAIAMSVNRLKDLESKSRVIILLTDGANNSGRISPIAAAEAAAAFNTKVYTIAAGKGGVVPAFFTDQSGQVIRDRYGQPQIGQANFPVDHETLIEIAEITGAESYKAANIKELTDIYEEINKLEKTEVELKQFALYQEAFMYPLLLGLCFLGFERFLSNTRFRRLP